MRFTEELVQRPRKHFSHLHFYEMVLRYILPEKKELTGALGVFWRGRCCCICVCFTLNCSFYALTSSTASVRADSSSQRYKLCGHKTTTQAATVRQQYNAMPLLVVCWDMTGTPLAKHRSIALLVLIPPPHQVRTALFVVCAIFQVGWMEIRRRQDAKSVWPARI